MGTGSFVHGHFPLNLRSCSNSCGLFVMHVSSGMIGYSSLIMSLASHDMIQTRLWNLFETFSFSGCSNVHLSNAWWVGLMIIIFHWNWSCVLNYIRYIRYDVMSTCLVKHGSMFWEIIIFNGTFMSKDF